MIILRWLSQGSRYCHSSRFDLLTLSLNTSFDIFWRKWGHPLAGRSRSTDVSCEKNFLLSPFFSSRTVRDLSVTRPCFLFMRCRTLVRTSHPSGSRHWKISKREFFPPLASQLAPENCRYHAASNGSGFTDPMAPFRVQPLYGSRRGRTSRSQPLRVVFEGRDSG